MLTLSKICNYLLHSRGRGHLLKRVKINFGNVTEIILNVDDEWAGSNQMTVKNVTVKGIEFERLLGNLRVVLPFNFKLMG